MSIGYNDHCYNKIKTFIMLCWKDNAIFKRYHYFQKYNNSKIWKQCHLFLKSKRRERIFFLEDQSDRLHQGVPTYVLSALGEAIVHTKHSCLILRITFIT